MTLFRFTFRFLLLICCVIAITSYRINHRPFEDRHDRAVTEWRFRRNFLFPLSYLYPNYVLDDRLDNNEAIENENGLEIYDKKYIPNSLDDRITTK